MIRSAPSRFAAITPHKPTAPSPTTATVFPGPTSAARAAWCPVPITSESVSSDGISASSAPIGSTTSVPSACGTRTTSPWPPSTSSEPYRPPCRHSLCRPSRQNTQVPSDHRNGETTRSPVLIVRTSVPTASTTPMNSCPIRRPVSVGSIALYGHRSLPQIAARVTRTSASVDSIRWASGTSSTRTSPAPYIRVARMALPKQGYACDPGATFVSGRLTPPERVEHGTRLIAEHGEVEPGDPFGVGDEVDLGDLAVRDRESAHGERPPVEEGDHPSGAVDEGAAHGQVDARPEQGLPGDGLGAADML